MAIASGMPYSVGQTMAGNSGWEGGRMAKVHESIKLYTPAERVWEVIGDFGAVADWHPLVRSCDEDWEGTMQLRRLGLPDQDEPLVERLLEHDDAERRYTYSIVSGPMPLADYVGTIHVNRDDAGSCTVEWSGEFRADGISDEEAVALVQRIYRAGLEHLKYRLGA